MTFSPDTDIPDLLGKCIVVTGGSSGLGKETVLQLAKHNPAIIYLSARTSARADAAIADIEREVPAIRGRLRHPTLDLGSFVSIAEAADTLLTECDRLDLLINNAGLMASPPGLTTDGYEVQFGSNYLGPALFTRLLLPVLRRTAGRPGSDVRVVNTDGATIGSVARYGQSKLADYLHTKDLARQEPSITSVAIHPGVVNTGLFDDLKKRRPYLGYAISVVGKFFLTGVANGAHEQLRVSTTSLQNVRSSASYNSSHQEYTQAILSNEGLCRELAEWTEAEFEEHGY